MLGQGTAEGENFKSPTSLTGNIAEQACERFLIKNNFDIIGRNFRCKGGEIDLIARDNNARDGKILVFVEVRYRAATYHGNSSETVTYHKQRKLRIAAQVYLMKYFKNNPPICRFDVVGITQIKETGHNSINNINNNPKNAFRNKVIIFESLEFDWIQNAF